MSEFEHTHINTHTHTGEGWRVYWLRSSRFSKKREEGKKTLLGTRFDHAYHLIKRLITENKAVSVQVCVILAIIGILQQLIFPAEVRTSEEANVFSTTSSARWWLSSGSQKRPEWERRQEREGQQRREVSGRSWLFHRRTGQGGKKQRRGRREKEREDRVIWGDEGDKGGGETFGRRDKERGARVLGVQQQRGRVWSPHPECETVITVGPSTGRSPTFYTTHTHTHVLNIKNLKFKHTCFQQTAWNTELSYVTLSRGAVINSCLLLERSDILYILNLLISFFFYV